MTHPIYRSQTREKNQALLRSLTNPSGPDPQGEACRAHQREFAPSLYLELDWQRFRPDLEDANLQRIFDLIHGLLFVIGLPTNLMVRDPGDRSIALSDAEEARLGPIFGTWQDVWHRPEGAQVWADFERFVDTLRTPARLAVEEALCRDALAALDKALSDLTDLSNLHTHVDHILINAHYAFLDLPWTRCAVRAALAAQPDPNARFHMLPADKAAREDPAAIADALRRRAATATAPGAASWAALLTGAADRLAKVDAARLTGDEGDWTSGLSCCGECAMWFASKTVAAMDNSVGFAQWGDRDMIYMPPDLGVSVCPFCGFSAPNNVPTLFYAENRSQVIYLAPTNGMMSESEAVEYWGPFIQQLQDRYLARRDAAAKEKFWSAAELVTHDVVAFFYAIQMGDTIAEDHVFNMVSLADGSALILDGTKRFARMITPGEVRACAQTYRVEETPPELAAKFQDGGRVLGPDEVGPLIEDFLDVNDAIDAEVARRRRGGDA